MNENLGRLSFGTLFGLACGRQAPSTMSQARIWQLTIGSAFGALIMAAMWGAMTGTDSVAHAARNLVAVPLVLLLSALCAIPAGVLGLKLSGADYRARDLLLSFASALFGGTLVMAALAPLAAIYYHTSFEIGNHLAFLSVVVAILVGALLFFRGALSRAEKSIRRRFVVFPSVVIIAIQLAALLQFIALASPILPGGSFLDGGFDALAR
jgi:hypothetical protein